MDEFDDEAEKKLTELVSETEKLMDEFWNRRIYKELSLEILATIPDDQIELAILDYIDTKISDYRMRFDVISNMPEGFQMVHSTMALETQVNNGGFNQFFYNPSGQYAEMALRSLNLIGATEYYEILQKAIETYMNEKDNLELQNLYSQRTLEGFSKSYKLTLLSEWDEKFYALGECLHHLRMDFIRSNPEMFIGS
jgi:hypothetical protein